MGVYIPNMEKPKDCSECILADKHLNGLYEAKYYCRLEAEICPLIEIDLVRCGECKWWESAKNGWNGWCRKQIDAYATFYADDFCSYGERRSE